MSLLNRFTGKGTPAEEPKNGSFLAFGLLAGAALPEENWLRGELAMPAHSCRRSGPEKVGQAVRQLSTRIAARPPQPDLDQMNCLLDLLAPIKISDCKTKDQTMSFNLAGMRNGVEVELVSQPSP